LGKLDLEKSQILNAVKKAEGRRQKAEGRRFAIQCRSEAYTVLQDTKSEILEWGFNPYSLRSLLWAGIRIPFCLLPPALCLSC
jgi:hypothetical protein